MNVIYNAYALNKPITGVGRYLQALSFMNLNYIKIALTPNSKYCWFNNFNAINSSNVKTKLMKLLWNFFHPLFYKFSFDLYHSPFPSLPFFLPKNCKKIITVHDVLFLSNPEWYPSLECLFMKLSLYLSINKADVIICVSQTTKEELLKFYPTSFTKIIVVYNPIIELKNIINHVNFPLNSNITSLIKKKKYFILPSNRHPRKNIINTIEGFLNSEFYQNGYKLCLCGLDESIDKYSIDKNIVELKYLSDFDYNILIKNSSGILYFSLAEGFGYPIIEAIEANIPIFCSRIPTSTEIIGDFNDFLCDDFTTKGISNFLNIFYNQPSKVNELLEHLNSLKNEFNYHKFEHSMLKIYTSQVIN